MTVFAAYQNRASQYDRVRVESGVASARPIDLVVMVYEGAIAALAKAAAQLRNGDIGAKNSSITRAIRIIDEGLRAPLDASAGSIAGNLADLYDYMTRRLLQASARNDAAMIDEVRLLLVDLKSAWDELAAKPASA
ncbi:MAG: flagellar export chaperone FliS [Burkholderiales bacterium]|nr:flagellar export chaperone FliS [Burkholderiales bacterium]